MMTAYIKPLPVAKPWSKKFWEAARQHKLIMQKCNDCGKLIFYPRKVCPECWSDNVGWIDVSGKAKVLMMTTTIAGVEQAFAPDLPYVLAVVELEEGVHMITNIVDCKPEDVKIGTALEVVFRDCTDEISLPVFRPIQGKGSEK
jgi:uncharacterized OB-fold protein